jgi:hypothetical protein
VPSFVTPAVVRDQVNLLKGNLNQNLAGTPQFSYITILVQPCILIVYKNCSVLMCNKSFYSILKK